MVLNSGTFNQVTRLLELPMSFRNIFLAVLGLSGAILDFVLCDVYTLKSYCLTCPDVKQLYEITVNHLNQRSI